MALPSSLIQTRVVRYPILQGVFLSASLAACAHTREEVRSSTVAESAPPSIMGDESESAREREVIAVDTAPPVETASPPRPRLSRTITLGEGAEPQYTPSAAPPAPGSSPSVVVNNNIVVQDGPRYYGGHSGYGGYAGHGYGRPTTFYDGRVGGASRGSQPQWSSTGWEGARRTAAPGQTPGIGGNWAPPPSYGPAQMK